MIPFLSAVRSLSVASGPVKGSEDARGPRCARWVRPVALLATFAPLAGGCAVGTEPEAEATADREPGTGRSACEAAGSAWIGGKKGSCHESRPAKQQKKKPRCGRLGSHVCESSALEQYLLQSDPPVEPAESFTRWNCGYSPTMDNDWHNDVLCTNGAVEDRPYLREWDSFITQDEIMASAAEYERQLNG